MSDRTSPDVPPMKCLGCGYILENLPENRCPECGKTFSPDNPFTFSYPGHLCCCRGGSISRPVPVPAPPS